MAELTPAQECAVEIGRDNAEKNCPGVYITYPDAYFLEHEISPNTVDIISRYIREAEQRGREEAANGIMEHINEHKDKWYRKDLMTQLTYLEISAIAGEFIAPAEAPHD